jgi:hypothetical protein
MTSSKPNWLPEASPLSAILLEFRVLPCDFEGHNQSICHNSESFFVDPLEVPKGHWSREPAVEKGFEGHAFVAVKELTYPPGGWPSEWKVGRHLPRHRSDLGLDRRSWIS